MGLTCYKNILLLITKRNSNTFQCGKTDMYANNYARINLYTQSQVRFPAGAILPRKTEKWRRISNCITDNRSDSYLFITDASFLDWKRTNLSDWSREGRASSAQLHYSRSMVAFGKNLNHSSQVLFTRKQQVALYQYTRSLLDIRHELGPFISLLKGV